MGARAEGVAAVHEAFFALGADVATTSFVATPPRRRPRRAARHGRGALRGAARAAAQPLPAMRKVAGPSRRSASATPCAGSSDAGPRSTAAGFALADEKVDVLLAELTALERAANVILGVKMASLKRGPGCRSGRLHAGGRRDGPPAGRRARGHRDPARARRGGRRRRAPERRRRELLTRRSAIQQRSRTSSRWPRDGRSSSTRTPLKARRRVAKKEGRPDCCGKRAAGTSESSAAWMTRTPTRGGRRRGRAAATVVGGCWPTPAHTKARVLTDPASASGRGSWLPDGACVVLAVLARALGPTLANTEKRAGMNSVAPATSCADRRRSPRYRVHLAMCAG